MARMRRVISVLLLGALLASCEREEHRFPSYIPPQEWVRSKIGDAGSVEWRGMTGPQPGDEIWLFRSPDESWEQLMGTEGHCLLRNGAIVDGYVTAVN